MTIRILLGFIESQGLIRAESEGKRRYLAKDAYRSYRAERFRTLFNLEVPLRHTRDALLQLNRLRKRLRPSRRLEVPRVPTIRFVGLWDTVDAYGLPIGELTWAWNFLFPLAMPNREPGG